MRVFISAGEPSGDLHGANLVTELQSAGVQCVGFGGPKMQAAGCHLYQDLTQYAVMFLQALRLIPQMWQHYRHAERILGTGQIDAVVLIDFPGFNWWVARAAKRHAVPVFYYGVPQMWGWLPGRVRKLRRLVDHVLCKLPFEVPWFAARGVTARYVGHPYFDELSQRQLDREFMQEYDNPQSPLVTLLPGSRNQEVNANLEWLLETAERIRREVPQATFAVACFHPAQAEYVRGIVAEHRLPVDVFVNRTPELIEMATLCLACSGSVSLELMYHEKPSIIVYRLSWLQAIGKWWVMTCRFITLVNLLATDDISRRAARPGEATGGDPQVPFPEFAWMTNPAQPMARLAVAWLQNPAEWTRRRNQLAQLKQKFAQPGATVRAAAYLLEQLYPRSTDDALGESSPLAVVDHGDQDLPAAVAGAAAAAAQRAAFVAPGAHPGRSRRTAA
jgi:lipid-A-disaccharide synthase